MKNMEHSKNSRLRENFAALFDDTKYYHNIDAVRNADLHFYRLFDVIMIVLLSLLLLSTFFSNYALSLRYVYVAFILWSILELVLMRHGSATSAAWKMPLCLWGVGKTYLFCLLSSVFYNRDAQAITFFVFLLLIPTCFTFRFRVLLRIQFAAALAFCVSTAMVKVPGLIFSEILICLIFTLIGLVVGTQSSQMRLDNYDLYRETAIVERRNKNIFDTTPCGMLELVFTGMAVKVLFANKTVVEMFGYSQEAFWAKTDWDFSTVVHPKDLHLVADSLQNPAAGFQNACDFRLKNEADGQYHWVSCKSLITKVEDGRITVLADFLDVDEKKRAESESEAKSRFLSRMSHEIRTPINAIMGMAELERQELDSGSPDLAALRNYAGETTDASRYLLTLVNDILDTSRIENNKIELHTEIVNADKYLRNVISLIKPLADAKNITFTCTRETPFREAYYGDSVRVQQILINLLNNAIKFTPEGGTVTLLAKAIKETETTTTLCFTVSDTGIGMSEDFQKKLFQPFTQENAGNTSPFAGTGLGLNIARTLAQKMNGDITCRSEYGKGTTFVTTIVVGNVEDDPGTPAAPVQAAPIVQTVWGFTGIRILLCEDHPLNQKITKALLERHHCQVEIAGNGAEGVSMVAAHPAGYYAMILMDIRMPIMDGLQATAEIRELSHPDAKTIPIVAMSANAFAEDIRQSLAAGMNDHLAKPVDAALLYAAVARYTGAADGSSAKPAVLIVDDIEINAAVIAKVLERSYETIYAADGEQALKKLETTDGIIAVVTDIQMPNMDGMELIRAIRKNYKYDHIAILANTQYEEKGQSDQLLAIGADDFVYKPESPQVLFNRLRNIIARYKN